MGETGINIIVGVVILLLLVFNVFFRKGRAEKTPLGRVVSIFSDLSKNEKLVENFSFHRTVKKLRTGSWKRNGNKVEFLPQDLRMMLAQTFEMSEEVNERIEAARKFKSDSYMAGIDVSKLKEPLARSKQRLQYWLQENIQNPEYMPKRRGLFG